ncbi:MAG: preprotein translocase subunit SecG [Clostridiales bacterium]|nr:preprotein translocase subunit SecG [Clostridiales bacterium]
MSTIQVILTVLLLLASLVMIVSVLLQKGDADAMSAITGGGGTNSFFGKNKSKTMQGRLAAATKGASIVFVVLCLVMIFVK